jgi:phage recombination protein Bet
MNQQLSVIDYDEPALPVSLGQSQYPGASQEHIQMVINYCRAQNLDPLQKPVHLVAMWDSGLRAMRTVVMPGIALYRTQASRSGEYGGVDEPQFGQDMEADIGDAKGFKFPLTCSVTVYRLVKDKQVSFTATERWMENYAKKKAVDPTPNMMWTKRPYGQLAKCAEAQALRKAFPELCGHYTAEEMEGKEMGVEPASNTPAARDTEKAGYSPEVFKKNFPAWKAALEGGQGSHEGLIGMIETKGKLDVEQIQQIKSIVIGEQHEAA